MAPKRPSATSTMPRTSSDETTLPATGSASPPSLRICCSVPARSLEVEIVDYHARAASSQPQSDSPAHALACAGNDGDFVREV